MCTHGGTSWVLQEVLYFACEQSRADLLMQCISLLIQATIKQVGVRTLSTIPIFLISVQEASMAVVPG